MSKHKTFLAWVITLAVTGIWHLVLGPTEAFVGRLSPLSIWQLPTRAWPSILATLLAALVAWISAVLVGILLGGFTAAGELARRENGKIWTTWSALASAIRRGYTWVYIVPLVLTISVVSTILLQLESKKAISQPIVGFLLIVASGVTLAGQRVFVAIDHAVTTAGTEETLLASSLYLGKQPRGPRGLGQAWRILRESRFLVECRISHLAEALEQGFHLAVVGVVILETASGLRVYEKLFPSEAGLIPWGGGIGRVIIDGQNAVNPTLVAGSVWLILIIDSMIAWAIHATTDRKWVTPYRSRQ